MLLKGVMTYIATWQCSVNHKVLEHVQKAVAEGDKTRIRYTAFLTQSL